MKKLLIVVAAVAVGFLGYQFYVRKLAGQQQAASALLPVNVLEVTEREYFPHVSFVAKIAAFAGTLSSVTGCLPTRRVRK